jgi:hypothetical protein
MLLLATWYAMENVTPADTILGQTLTLGLLLIYDATERWITRRQNKELWHYVETVVDAKDKTPK